MKQTLFAAICICFLQGASYALQDFPKVEHLRWVNLRTEKTIVDEVNASLSDPTYTNLREIGIFRDAALVIVSSREKYDTDYLPFEYDYMEAFSCNLKKKNCHHIWGGYSFVVVAGAVFSKGTVVADLVFTYASCTECESSTLISAFTYDGKDSQWAVRSWGDKTQPGGTVTYGDIEWSGDGVYSIHDFESSGVDQIGIWLKESGEGKVRNSYSLLEVKNDKDVVKKVTSPAEIAKFKKALCKYANSYGPTSYEMCRPYRPQ